MINDIDYKQLGERIKKYRRKAHLTQEQTAAAVDCAVSTIAHAEAGDSKPSLPLLIKLSNVLGITVDQLVCDSLPNIEAYIDKDFSELLADCSKREKKIIFDIAAAAKETIRKNKP